MMWVRGFYGGERDDGHKLWCESLYLMRFSGLDILGTFHACNEEYIPSRTVL